WGVIGDTRGDVTVNAGAIGKIIQNYGQEQPDDPRSADPFTAAKVNPFGGLILAPGDGSITLQTRGDLVLGTVADPGRVPLQSAVAASAGATSGSSFSWFTLWQPDTAINLVSAGGNIVPERVTYSGGGKNPNVDGAVTDLSGDFIYPPILNVIAP